jgi:CheY-like chemotaxis protein
LPGGEGLSVLLVEDVLINQIVASRLLTQHKVLVTTANSGREALNRLAEREFDAVLMDVHMPEMDGLEATRQIRASGMHFAEIPVIAMTASTSQEDVERCISSGMNAHVAKPFEIDNLLRVLSHWTRSKRASMLPTAKAAVASKPAPLPARVPGIEVTAAWKRVLEDTPLYLELLDMFVKRYALAPKQLQQREAEHAQEHLHIVHTLISSAAAIGAAALSAHARDLQDLLVSGAAADRETTLLVSELATVLASARQLIARPMAAAFDAEETVMPR